MYIDYDYSYYQARQFYMDDVPLVQPVGFVWFKKPRYRIPYDKRIIKEYNDKE